MLLASLDPLLIKWRHKRRIIEYLLLHPAQSGNQSQIFRQRMPLGQLLQSSGPQGK